MPKFWEFFENMNEYVYVADMATYALVYMNRQLRDRYGIRSEADYIGKPCYDVLHHNSGPCTMCTNCDLKPGHFVESWHYDPFLKQNLSTKETVIEEDGRRYHIEIAIDISPQKWRANVVRDYKDIEALAQETLRLAMKQGSPEKSIAMFLEYMGKTLGGDRTYIFERNVWGNDDNTYEWVAAGVEPAIDVLQNVPAEVCASWYSQFSEDKYIEIGDLEDIRTDDPAQYEILKRQNIQRLLVVPLYDENKILGFYGVDNPSGEYMGHVANFLLMMAGYIVSSLRHRNLIRRLKEEEIIRAAALVQREVMETLAGAQMGLWQIILGDGMPRFIADDATAVLIGAPDGASPEETFALWHSNVHGEFQEELSRCMDKICAGMSAEIVYTYRHPECGALSIRFGGILDNEYSGPGIKLRGYYQDISEYSNSLNEQIENNQRLMARAQENLDMVNEIIGSGLWYMDFDEQGNMTRVFWSQPFRWMLGFRDTGDFPNVLESWSDRLHPDDKEEVMAAYWGSVAGKMEYDVKYRLMKRDGEYNWFQARGRVARYPNGAPRLFLGTFVNISEELRAQQAFEDAYRAANQANAAKTEFLANMSHDIRTPLNAIIGMTTIASMHIGDVEKMEHCLDKIAASSRHLLGLVNEVLDMNRIESGKVSLKVENFNFLEMIDSFVSMAKPLAESKGHHFTVDIQDMKHKKVLGDQERILQCLMNFMGNAVKYTPDGGRISVRISEKPTNHEKRGCYEFQFEDNGIGIDSSFLERIFDPFARADDEQVIQQQGTGLGMSITKTIIQMMNGEVKVESQLGRGSRFTATIFLELCSEKDGQLEKQLPDSPGRQLRKSDFRGKRILLVEDNQLNAEIAQELLLMTGVSIDVAENGKAAVEYLSHVADGYFDLVFMDIQMPVMNGHAATRAIRASERKYLQEVPIIAMSANAFAEDVQRSKEAGMNAHIAKPLDFDCLIMTLSQWLGQKEAGNKT